jgi:acyl-CoA synthetase (AMP-forming)/AMP-acid ligase II
MHKIQIDMMGIEGESNFLVEKIRYSLDSIVVRAPGGPTQWKEAGHRFYQHQDMAEYAFVSVPASKWGEVPSAFVVMKPRCRAAEEELIQFYAERLSSYKWRKFSDFLSSLSKGGNWQIAEEKVAQASHILGPLPPI